jgi:hypothetical protein
MVACKSEFTTIIAKGPSEQDDPGKRKKRKPISIKSHAEIKNMILRKIFLKNFSEDFLSP